VSHFATWIVLPKWKGRDAPAITGREVIERLEEIVGRGSPVMASAGEVAEAAPPRRARPGMKGFSPRNLNMRALAIATAQQAYSAGFATAFHVAAIVAALSAVLVFSLMRDRR
jgi:hypothetical protein